MTNHCHRAKRRARLIALALTTGGPLCFAPAAFAWPVGESGDVTIENFTAKAQDGAAFAIARAEFDNTNLSKDEIVKMLTPDTPVADERALVQKLKADKITIPAIDIVAKDGTKIHLRDFVADAIDAGKAERLEIGGLDAAGVRRERSGLGQVRRASPRGARCRRRVEGRRRVGGDRPDRAPRPLELGVARHRRAGSGERARQDDPCGVGDGGASQRL